MKRFAAAIAFGASAFFSQAASAAPLDRYIGTFADEASRGVEVVEIRRQGGQLRVRAEGSCSPQNCQWGEVNATAFSSGPAASIEQDTQVILAEFDLSAGRRTLLLSLHGDQLTVRSFTFFRAGDRRSDYVSEVSLQRQNRRFEEDCINVRRRNLEIERHGGTWRLTDGNSILMTAGRRRVLERTIEVMDHYRLNQQCFIGRPDASLTYYLNRRTGAFPQGYLANENCIALDPRSIAVRRNAGSGFSVVDGADRLLFSAPNRREARQIVRLIRQNDLRYSCWVGRGRPFTYLRR